MGHSAKKKRKNKGRAAPKDHSLLAADNSELISEELTAVCAIFQEDCSVVSESPAQVLIKLRPYSKYMGYEDLDVSASLYIRCSPGYPYKSPRLLITPEKGLSKSDADALLSLLYDQANANAREGRVMIFNLVEAAQEFLSEIVPIGQLPSSDLHLAKDDSNLLPSISSERASPHKEPYVYGFVDLFCGSGKSWNWSLATNNSSEISSSLGSKHVPISKQVYEGVERNFQQKEVSAKEDKKHRLSSSLAKLETLEEYRNLPSTNSSSSSMEDLVGCTSIAENEKDVCHDAYGSGSDGCEDQANDYSEPSSSGVMADGQISQIAKRDLMMVHLLRLACGSKGSLAGTLPEIASELCNLGLLSEWGRDMSAELSSPYNKFFDRAYHQHMGTSKVAQFWEPVYDIGGHNTPSVPSSRYLSDFEELKSLGRGGFGHVVLCKNKLDGRQYAVKKIHIKDKNPPLDDRILREVATLSRLQHQHVVRYYQAWFEMGVSGCLGDSAGDSRTAASTTFTYMDGSSTNIVGDNKMLESTCLYIQMEYCPRTLRELFESYRHFDKDLAWHLFHQVVEGLAHIHGQGIIHRDLTPNNIFFDARNDIKIGDFGLAKFLKLEQLDQDTAFPADTPGVSVDRTSQVGTYFYTAPEIEHGWPKIDEKADMYSLGIVFFELWHPFGTAMERNVVLSDLKHKRQLPPSWVAEFPEQASLLEHLMSPIPSDRPSATELLQQAFPPRMEHDLLDKFLRTMQTSEDTSVYDKVIGALFDEEMLIVKNNNLNSTSLKLVGNEASNILYSDMDTQIRDHVIDVSREVFRRHCARHLEIMQMHLLDDSPELKRETVKLLSHGGYMINLCHELRLPFVRWVVASQILSFRRYEISYVYRRAIGRSPPNRYLQGDFDIVGGASALTEAEVIKVTVDILALFFHSESCNIHLNHGNLLIAIWSWTGVTSEHRQKVAELLCLLSCLQPQSPERKSRWVVIRHQLLQELNLAETVVNRLQTVGLRFCGSVDQALPRLRGALRADKSTRKALDQLAELYSYLKVWKIDQHIFIDALMPPTESCHRDLFFQVEKVWEIMNIMPTEQNKNIYLRRDSPGSPTDGTLVAVGGRYDSMLHQMWEHENRSSPPGAVGMSLALETIIQNASSELRPFRSESTASILICSKGGGGLLDERMELAAELWDAGIKAEFVLASDPSLTEQYEYANEHDIRCLVIITDSGVSQTDSAKVHHLELKRDKVVGRKQLIKFLLDAMASQFRNPAIWS